MMMQCPRCSTRWRVAAAAPVENPLFKCGRCHYLFRQFPGAPSGRDAAPEAQRHGASAPPAEPESLEFIFPERQPAELLLMAESPAAPIVAPSGHQEAELVVAPPPAIPPSARVPPVDV